MRSVWTAILLLAAPAMAQDAVREPRFDYDVKAPLDVREIGVEHRGAVAVHDISYASPKGGRVTAYLVAPEGKGPFAAVIWGHWYWANSEFRNRKEFLEEAIALAPSGVISLMTDGPIARAGHVEDPDPIGARRIGDLVQAIVDMRRGADLLLARPDVDARRMAYVGHSYNASVGGFLSGIDKRFKAFVLMAGSLSDAVNAKSREFEEFRQKVGAERMDAFTKENGWSDPGRYVAHSGPATVFLQYGTEEDFLTPARAREYASLVGEPKKFQLYDAPHALNAAARRDRFAFLAEQLSVRVPDAAAIARVPDLPQPATQ